MRHIAELDNDGSKASQRALVELFTETGTVGRLAEELAKVTLTLNTNSSPNPNPGHRWPARRELVKVTTRSSALGPHAAGTECLDPRPQHLAATRRPACQGVWARLCARRTPHTRRPSARAWLTRACRPLQASRVLLEDMERERELRHRAAASPEERHDQDAAFSK
eukprot:6265860-Prymnesium_polylepis.1